MMNETARDEERDIQESVPETLPSPGELLRTARKEQGLSVDEVVPHLGLPARVLRALEDDDYERLPAPMYVRGYARRYCALLEIPDDPVLAAIEQQLTLQGINDQGPSLKLPAAPPRRLRFRLSFIYIPLLLLLLAAAGVWVWAMQTNSPIQASPSEQPNMAFEPAQETTVTELGSVEGLDPQQGEFPVGAQGEQAVAGDDGIRTLSIQVLQQSWVEVFDAEGDMLVADLKASGSEMDISGLAPFTVTLGYAPGVAIHYEGRPVVVSTVGSDNTATLEIGDDSAGEH